MRLTPASPMTLPGPVNQLHPPPGHRHRRGVLIRREAAADAAVIRAVTAAAFARPGEGEPSEAPLVGWLRACPAWLPRLSLVAVGPDGAVAGHVVCSRATVSSVSSAGAAGAAGAVAPVLALGPLSVRPDQQGRGVGQALVHAVLGAADALGEPLVALLGSTGYYPRFGFRLASEFLITPPDPAWVPHFQVRPLTAYDPAVRGEFAYPEPFDRL